MPGQGVNSYTVPWFCTRVCSDVIGHLQPYWDPGHLTTTYTDALVFVLGDALDLKSYVRTAPTTTLPRAAMGVAPTG
jgi:hypothetical protein